MIWLKGSSIIQRLIL